MPSKLRMTLVAAAMLYGVAGCKEEILHDLDELRANRVQLALSQSGVDAYKKRDDNSWSILVSSVESSHALQAIEGAKAMQRAETDTEFSSSFIPSREERVYSLERGVARSLERTLVRLPGVVEARVHIHSGAADTLDLIPAQEKQSASVLLLAGGPSTPSEDAVRRLVAGGAGISAERVNVVVSALPEVFAVSSPESRVLFPLLRPFLGHKYILGFCLGASLFGAGFFGLLLISGARKRKTSSSRKVRQSNPKPLQCEKLRPPDASSFLFSDNSRDEGALGDGRGNERVQ